MSMDDLIPAPVSVHSDPGEEFVVSPAIRHRFQRWGGNPARGHVAGSVAAPWHRLRHPDRAGDRRIAIVDLAVAR